MYPQGSLGLIVAGDRARNERENRGPVRHEASSLVCPNLRERMLLHTGQWMIKMGKRLKNASAHPRLALSEEAA
ncbi:MAG: hypothetical protein JXB85_13390 [Anaerolineales bacterium]|nr:hypothetical protein [Anaerolineales bacterium]